jgi:hypothetical protein
MDLACNDLTAFVLFDRASIAAAAATVSAQGVFLTLFFGDLRRTFWARIQSTASTSNHTFALMEEGIESLVARFAWDVRKKRAAFLARSLTMLQRHVEVFASERQKKGRGNNAHRGKGNSVVKPHLPESGPASQDYGE